MRPASSLVAPAAGRVDGWVAPPTATGVAGGVVAGTLGEPGAFAVCPGVGLDFGRGVAGLGVLGTGVGRGVGALVGVGLGVAGTVTVTVPPDVVAPVFALKVTVQVPADPTRAEPVQVEPLAGGASETTIAPEPLRVSRAAMDLGLGLPTESTRNAKSVLVVPLRGLTDPLCRLFLARVGLTVRRRAAVAMSKAKPELRAARC